MQPDKVLLSFSPLWILGRSRNTQNELKLGTTFWSLRVAARLTGAALLYNLPLMTRNVDDVKHISGLQIINPFAALA